MANVIKLRKGLDVNLKGKAAKEEFQVKKPAVYALMPDDFTGMKPKVVVKENDVVKVACLWTRTILKSSLSLP